MNKIILMGRLTRDPEIRYSRGSKPVAVARYTLAVDRRFKRDDGIAADFIRIVAFDRRGEFAEKYLRQGTKVLLSDRVQTGTYERDGVKVSFFEVVAEEQEFAESKNANQNGHKDLDGVIDSILEIYGKIRPEENFKVSELLDYSKARHNLNGRLTNTEKNRELLGDLPHRDFMDLSLSYFVDVTPGGDWGCVSVRVTNAHMELWDVTEEDL